MKVLCKECVEMNNYLKKYSDLLIYGHFLIAFASIGQSLMTYYILGYSFSPWIVSLEGSASFLMYNLTLYLSLPKSGISPYRRTNWVMRHRKLLVVLNSVVFVIFFLSLFKVNLYSKIYFIFISFLSLLYILGFRQIPGLKVFHITLIWVLSCVGLPFVELYSQGNIPASEKVIEVFFMRFLFYFICILPFDIRDLERDRAYKLKTLPLLIGKKNSIRLCYSLLAVHSFLLIFTSYPIFIKISFWLTNILIFLLFKKRIFHPKAKYEDAYLLDFMLFAQFAIASIFLVIG